MLKSKTYQPLLALLVLERDCLVVEGVIPSWIGLWIEVEHWRRMLLN